MNRFINYKLLFVVSSLFFIFPSCKEKEDMEMPMDDEEIVMLNPCPLGKYNGVVISYQNNRAEIDALGASAVHSWIQWDFIEENLTAPFLTEEEVTEEMVARYASGEQEGIDWTFTDNHINEYNGLDLIMGIGSGWINSLPLFNGEKITPDIIGRDQYIGQLYLHTRACVRRYKGKILLYQIENEPNISQILIALGYREGNSWYDVDFMTRVLSVLEKAVRMEDPDALVTINFSMDTNTYEEDINRWVSMVDIVGIDSYQDLFTTDPIVAADSILVKIEQISNLNADKPVIILETGFASGPEESGFSEVKQKIFIEEIYSKMEEHNGCGVMYFKHSTSEQDNGGLFSNRYYRGLIRENGQAKLAWHFLKEFFK